MRIMPTTLALLACAPTTDDTNTTAHPSTYPIIAVYPDTIAAPVHLPCTVLICYAGQCSPTLDYTVTTAGLLTVTPPDSATAQVWCSE